MVSIFVYGSLLNSNELKEQFRVSVSPTPAVLKGFKRHYGQLSDYRTDENGDYGNVLTVEEEEGYRCNGLLITDLPPSEIEELKERETGYELRELSSERLEAFGEDSISTDSFYISIGYRETEVWNPLRGYMELCEKGAENFGSEFHKLFRETTYRFSSSDIKPHE